MKYRLFILFSFLVITLIWWLPTIYDNNEQQNTDTYQDIEPEFTAKLLHQEIYDEDGNINQEVFSQSMEHYSELTLTHFKQPEFIIYQNNKPYWRLSARIGNLQNNALILDENVTMLQIVDNTLVNKISTEYIEINLKTNIVKSDKPITIEGKNVFIQGQGLTANLNQGTIKLTDHVQTRIN
ncbi:MAG: LPS export ABC transporter periplasmic protein LptC [Gammaproteobacteria bacterium]|nr:LPS export ABC transporter periplasmic protein LptC [Gammaproteobacteria bacterium]